jgi:hypothetical protein
MTPADTSAIANAIIATLGADALLLSLMPNGVYYDIAPPGSTRFVTVTLVEGADLAEFGRRAIEDAHYLIQAIALSSTQPNVAAAALRIEELLEDVPLSVAGYGWLTTYRTRPVRESAPDPIDRSQLWHHRGGYYRVQMTPLAPARRLAGVRSRVNGG